MKAQTIKTIPFEIKSGNQVVSWGSRGRFNYRNYRNKWYKILNYYFGPCDVPATVKVRVDCVRVYGKGKREFDEDNLRLGFKPMFDHLKYMGWIKDDSPKWVERHYFQTRRDAAVLEYPDVEPGIIIKIYHEAV
jgi:hypothetical protein